MKMLIISVTLRQKEIVEWALDALTDYWADQEENGIKSLPEVGRTLSRPGAYRLEIVPDPDVLDDLIKRLGQYSEIVHEGYELAGVIGKRKASREVRAAVNLQEKIRTAVSNKAEERGSRVDLNQS